MESDRADLGRVFEIGSSSSRESFRDDAASKENDSEDLPIGSGDEEAREASSRESRGALLPPCLIS